MKRHKVKLDRRVLTIGELGEIFGVERNRMGVVIRECGVDLRDAGEVVRFVVWWMKREEELRVVVE